MQIRPKFITALVLGNLICAILGFIFWYGEMLLRTPMFLWIFTPDSPLYALLFVVSMRLLSYGKKYDWLLMITGIGLVKYGLGAFFVHLHYIFSEPLTAFAIFMILFILVSHSIMILQSHLLFRKVPFSFGLVGVAMIWFLLNDFIDFFLFSTSPVPITPLFSYGSLALSVLVPFLIMLLYGKIFIRK